MTTSVAKSSPSETWEAEASLDGSALRRVGVYVALLGVPIFLEASSSGAISLPSGASVAENQQAGLIAAPASIALSVILLIETRARRRRSGHTDLPSFCMGVFVFVNLIAFLLGALSYGVSALAAAYLVQTLLPMLAYVVGRRVAQFPLKWLTTALSRFAWVPLLCFGLVALTTLSHGGRPWLDVGDYIGPLPIPQSQRYLPTVMAFALVMYARSRLLDRFSIKAAAVVAINVVFLAASHSRTGLVIVGVGIFAFILFDPRGRGVKRLTALFGACIAAGMLWFAFGSADLQNGPTALSRISGQNSAANVSSSLREGALVQSITETFTSPLGRMYQPTTDSSLGGTTSAYARVTNSENQIGDFGLKAGPLAVLALGFAFGNILLRARRSLARAVHPAPELDGLWIAAFAALIGAAFTQLVLAEAYTGVMLWFAFGVLHERAVCAEMPDEVTSTNNGKFRRRAVTLRGVPFPTRPETERQGGTKPRAGQSANLLNVLWPGAPIDNRAANAGDENGAAPLASLLLPEGHPKNRFSVEGLRRLILRGDGAVLSSLLQQGALFISGIGSAWLIGNIGRGELAYGMTVSSVAGIFAIGGWAPAATLGVAGQWGGATRAVDLLRPIVVRRAIASVLLAEMGMLPFLGKLGHATIPILIGTATSAVGVVAVQFLIGIAQGEGRATWANTLKAGISLSYAVPIVILAVVKFVIGGEVSTGAVAWAWAASWAFPVGYAFKFAGSRSSLRKTLEDTTLLRSMRSYSRAAFLGSIALFELLRVDVLLGMIFLSTAGLGNYVMASSFTGLLKALGQAFGVSMLSLVARTGNVALVDRRLRRYCLLIAAVVVVVAAAMWPIFQWVLPVEFRSSFVAAVVLVLASGVTALRRIMVELAKGANRPISGSLAEIAFVVFIGLMLLPGGVPHSANGLALATLVGCCGGLLVSSWGALQARRALQL